MPFEPVTFSAQEKSSHCGTAGALPATASCALVHLHRPLGPSPPQQSSCSPGRLKHMHGCTKELQAAQTDQPATARSPMGNMKPSSIETNAIRVDLHLPGSTDAQPTQDRPPLDHLTEHTNGEVRSKWH